MIFFNKMLQRNKYVILGLSVLVSIIFCSSCVRKTESLTINSAYFIDSETVGIVISKFLGGNEHPEESNQKVIIYNVKTSTSTDKGTISYQDPVFTQWVVSDTLLFQKNIAYIEGPAEFPVYSQHGTFLEKIPVPSDMLLKNNPYIAAVSPDNRYVLIAETYTNDYKRNTKLYDRTAKTFGNLQQFSSGIIFLGVENDGIHYLTTREFGSFVLYRTVSDMTKEDTLITLTDELKNLGRYNKLIMRCWAKQYVGFMSIDTTALPVVRFTKLDINSDICDIDTTSGSYLKIENDNVYMGNYKTGAPAQSIYD